MNIFEEMRVIELGLFIVLSKTNSPTVVTMKSWCKIDKQIDKIVLGVRLTQLQRSYNVTARCDLGFSLG